MAPKTLGQKHRCHFCDAQFYDLGKENPACPNCQHPLKIDSLEKKTAQNTENTADALEGTESVMPQDTDSALEDLGELDNDLAISLDQTNDISNDHIP